MKQMFQQFDVISTKSIKEIEQYDPRDMSTLAISLAKIIDRVERGGNRKGTPQQILQDILIGKNSEIKQFVFNRLAAASVPILYDFDARHLSNLIYAFGLVKAIIPVEDGTTYFDMLAGVAIPNLKHFNAQDLSNMLWAYANVGVKNTTLFKKTGDTIIEMHDLHEFWPQHLSNITWAYATLNEKNPELFKKVAGHIVKLDDLNRFDPQAMSKIIWAYATAGVSHPKLYEKVADHIVSLNNLDKFKPQELSNIVWAYAKAEVSYPKLFQKVADHIVSLDLRQFNGQDYSNTVWAFATAGVSHPKLYEKVADNIVSLNNLDKFKAQELSNTVWAYATAEESHPKLFQKLAGSAIKRQHEFIPQGVANFLWASATNGQIDQNLFSSLTPSVKANLDKYNEQGLANIAWAYAVADVAAPSIFDDNFISACLRKEDEFIVDELTQLYQWQLWQQNELQSNLQLPQSLQRKCYDAFISQVPEPSKLQDDVISELTSIGLEPEEEVLTKSGYRLDAAVELNGKQVGVEVDGPTHFVGSTRTPTGSTILKHRQVVNIDGIQLVSVPYWEWNKLKNDCQKKQQYLRTLLDLD